MKKGGVVLSHLFNHSTDLLFNKLQVEVVNDTYFGTHFVNWTNSNKRGKQSPL